MREPISAPGPERASQIADGEPYELVNGHRVRCMSAGGRHSVSHMVGGSVLASDPAAEGSVGADTGIVFNNDKNLRAPDLAVGVKAEPGWVREFPPLAVEYADTGQDEVQLQEKIHELLQGGTKYIWVVRLVGPLRVEVYSKNRNVRIFGANDELHAPGILANPVPVQALVDPIAARAATLRNLLHGHGYASIDAILAKGKAKGKAEGLAKGKTAGVAAALFGLLQARNLAVSAEQRAQILACKSQDTLLTWVARAASADSVDEVLTGRELGL